MQAIESTFRNNVLAIPWMLDAEDEDLDLEIHGCGCGCAGCACGCACNCSCSCSCSCDDTGANGDDSDSDDSSAGEESSDAWGFDDYEAVVTSANQCVTDMSTGIAEDAVQTGFAVAVGGAVGGVPGAVGAAAVAAFDDAADAAQVSEACEETVEAFSQNESFQQAMETHFSVGY